MAGAPVLPRGRISVPEFGASRRAVARPLPAGCQNDRHRSAVLASRLPWLDFSNFASVRLTSDGRYVAVGTADVAGKRIGGHRRFHAPGPITASSSMIRPMVNPRPFGKEILIFRTPGVLRFAGRDSRETGAIDEVDGDVEGCQGDGGVGAKLLPRPQTTSAGRGVLSRFVIRAWCRTGRLASLMSHPAHRALGVPGDEAELSVL